jgi:hypothetical protein
LTPVSEYKEDTGLRVIGKKILGDLSQSDHAAAKVDQIKRDEYSHVRG